jgi:serine-type D-Ala-D-Ala endopeptidase (penicillin-binding protein 7)
VRTLAAKTGFTLEAGRCIVIEVSMPTGPVIIVLLGATSSRARLADLMSIRHWLDGNETPVVTPPSYYASRPLHRHKTMALARDSKPRLVAYSARSGSKAHRPSGKRKTGKRHYSYPPSI